MRQAVLLGGETELQRAREVQTDVRNRVAGQQRRVGSDPGHERQRRKRHGRHAPCDVHHPVQRFMDSLDSVRHDPGRLLIGVVQQVTGAPYSSQGRA